MSDAPGTTSQPTTTEPDNSPEAWAAAENSPDEVIEEQAAGDDDEGAPPLDPNAAEAVDESAAEDNDPPPDFWSAERKALWAKITDPEIRAAIKGHVEDASKAIGGKMEEAAKARKEAEAKAVEFERERAQSVAWWTQAGPAIQRAIQGKWSGVNWNELAANNPAEYVKLKAEYETEVGQYNELAQRQAREVKAVEARAKEAHQAERAAEHTKLATKFPKEFGDPAKAQETYNTYSKFVLAHGISADRLEGIYEAGVVEIIQKAYKFDQLQAKAKEVTNPKPNQQNAATTPKRVAPGAANRSANPEGESQRQAIHALRTKDRHNLSEVADAFR